MGRWGASGMAQRPMCVPAMPLVWLSLQQQLTCAPSCLLSDHAFVEHLLYPHR